MSLSYDIKQKALELGFDLVGITNASAIDTEQAKLFTHWLNTGYAGRMEYLHKNLQKRFDLAKLLEDAKSVIVVGLNYKPSPQYTRSLRASPNELERAWQSHSDDANKPMGKVACYARYEDYHLFIKKLLRKLTDFITEATNTNHGFKICVDSAPVAERALAARAGLGFIGKNHMLINPELGPQILLGEIITTLKLPADEPIKADCGSCKKCIAACPTGALRDDGQLDANKCISYLTIECKGQIPSDLAEKIGDRIFGCDECVLACPYQKAAPVCKNKDFKYYPDRVELELKQILDMDEESFEKSFAGSAIKRLGLEGLKRNAQICLKNITNIHHQTDWL